MEFKDNTFFDQMGMPSEKDNILSNDNPNSAEPTNPSPEVSRRITETISTTPKRRETKADRLARLKAEKLEEYRQYCQRNNID